MENTIPGRMFATQYVMTMEEHIAMKAMNDAQLEHSIKEKLAIQLARELLNSKHIEFTRQNDIQRGRFVYRARLYAVPDDQVRILRQYENFTA